MFLLIVSFRYIIIHILNLILLIDPLIVIVYFITNLWFILIHQISVTIDLLTIQSILITLIHAI